MQLYTLQCRLLPETQTLDITADNLTLHADEDWVTQRAADAKPVALFVDQAQLETVLKNHPNRIILANTHNNGRKHAKKQLQSYLLKPSLNGHIPALFADFKNSGSAKRSVKRFLANAALRSENGLYVIGISPAILTDLSRSLEKCPAAPNRSKPSTPASRLLKALGPAIGQDVERAAQINRFVQGQSEGLQLVRRLILCATHTTRPVLILGETGTGKERVAKAIHCVAWGFEMERFKPFNCAASTGDLFNSELFGHRKGTFTGAMTDHTGLWTDAKDGSLFLDEVGELGLEQQAAILRALQENKVRPLGSTSEVLVNAKLISATNRPLPELVGQRIFRDDLYQRLSRGLVIKLPPLRDTPQDISGLATNFWRAAGREKPLSHSVLKTLRDYHWPRNVRQLKSVLEKLNTLFPDRDPTPEHIRLVFEMEGEPWS